MELFNFSDEEEDTPFQYGKEDPNELKFPKHGHNLKKIWILHLY